jgi:hypothetical protein
MQGLDCGCIEFVNQNLIDEILSERRVFALLEAVEDRTRDHAPQSSAAVLPRRLPPRCTSPRSVVREQRGTVAVPDDDEPTTLAHRRRIGQERAQVVDDRSRPLRERHRPTGWRDIGAHPVRLRGNGPHLAETSRSRLGSQGRSGLPWPDPAALGDDFARGCAGRSAEHGRERRCDN